MKFNVLKLVAALFLLTAQASAHFIWIHVLPSESGTRVEVLFGDGVYQNTNRGLVVAIEGLDSWTASGEKIAYNAQTWGLDQTLTGDVALVAARKPMGVFTPPVGGENRLLQYYAKGAKNLAAASTVLGLHAEVVATVVGDELELQLLFDGKPAEFGEFLVHQPGTLDGEVLIADENGKVRVPRHDSGMFAVRGRIMLDEPGDLDGEHYATIQHYTTLVIASLRDEAPASTVNVEGLQRVQHALSCRATYPGGLAGLAGVIMIQQAGTRQRVEFEYLNGQLEITAAGATETFLRWARFEAEDALRNLSPRSLTASGSLRLTPRDGSPTGRQIALGDAFATTYRVQENELLEFAQTLGRVRRSTTILQTEELEGALAPTLQVVTSRDLVSNTLLGTRTISDRYQIIDGGIFTKKRTVVTANGDESSIATLTFSGLELLQAATK